MRCFFSIQSRGREEKKEMYLSLRNVEAVREKAVHFPRSLRKYQSHISAQARAQEQTTRHGEYREKSCYYGCGAASQPSGSIVNTSMFDEWWPRVQFMTMDRREPHASCRAFSKEAYPYLSISVLLVGRFSTLCTVLNLWCEWFG